MYYHWGQIAAKKRNVTSSAHQAKKQCNFDSGWLERQQGGLHRKYIQEHQPNQFHCYNQNMGFVNRMDQKVAKYWYPNEKMVVIPVCLNGRCCSSGCVGIVSY